MATGENLFSMQDARNLIRYGGMRPDRDWLQFDCALSYGLVEYLRTLGMLKDHGWSAGRCIPHGAIRCRSTSPPASDWAAMSHIPTCSSPMGDFRTALRYKTVILRCRNYQGLALRENPTSIGRCRRSAEKPKDHHRNINMAPIIAVGTSAQKKSLKGEIPSSAKRERRID